jgi:hypothetical protein
LLAIALKLTVSAPWWLNRLEGAIGSAAEPLFDIRELSSIRNHATQELPARDRPAKHLLGLRAASR